jgi:2-polyprenyl-3-methyl-5-hydroxy-6-metoxy-1,4-benzoquinol methylase
MEKNVVDEYGWPAIKVPYHCGYIIPKILSVLRHLGALRILDLGSGNGKLCSEIYRERYEIVGVEYDKQGVEIARLNYPEIPFYNFGVQHNPYDLLKEQHPFDVVVSTEVIEHLFSPHLLPIYAKAVLKKEGYLVITTPYHGYFKNLALSLLGEWDNHHMPLWHGGHIKFWSRNTLTQLLQENGFIVVEFSGVGRVPYLWKSMVLIAKMA